MSNQNPINVNVTYVDPSKRCVNKVIFVLLALFLGGIGIHKFYIGQNFRGVMYLLFSWTFIPAFLAFCSALRVIFFEHADSQGDDLPVIKFEVNVTL